MRKNDHNLQRIKTFCKICKDQRDVKVLLSDIRDNAGIVKEEFCIVECSACKIKFIHPFLLPKQIRSIYPNTYYAHQRYDRHHMSIKERIKFRLKEVYYNKNSKLLFRFLYSFLKFTVNEPPFIKEGRLLDVGCGTGEYIREINSFGWKAYGIDPFVATDPTQNIMNGFAENICFGDKYFDVVRIWNVLEHCTDPVQVLQETNRVLKRDGYLLLYVPNYDSVDRKFFGRYWANLEIPRHLFHFNYADINNLLHSTGFTIHKIMFSGAPFTGLKGTLRYMRAQRVPNILACTLFFKYLISKSCFCFHKKRGIGLCITAQKVTDILTRKKGVRSMRLRVKNKVLR